MKNLPPLVTEENKHLYWAFGLVGGAWAISLLISGVVWLVGGPKGRDTNSVLPGVEAKFIQFGTESAFRNFMADQKPEWGDKSPSIPAELSETTGGNEKHREGIQVKDGEIFFSESSDTKIISATASAVMRVAATTPASGELFLHGQVLVVLNDETITGFDVASPKEPKQIWQYMFEGDQELLTSQLQAGKLYTISQTEADARTPCPMPVLRGTHEIKVGCKDIFYWPETNLATHRYAAVTLDAASGQVERIISWVGNSAHTTVYLSKNALYLGHSVTVSDAELLPYVLPTVADTLINQATKQKIRQTSELAISDTAKEVEYRQLLNRYVGQFSDDERMKWDSEFANRLREFKWDNSRDIEQTVMAKFDLDSFSIQAVNRISGQLLNQSALDEAEGFLRVAVTVGDSWESGRTGINDIHILNSQLGDVGSLQDFGREGRIFGVRFIGDQGYITTFDENDPVDILDLSVPEQPKAAGELKMPGYSTYLHPLSESLILGIGRQENQVKLALYDVSEMGRPDEKAQYVLNEYWSDIVKNLPAMVVNPVAKTFFVPGNKGGYFFSWITGTLKLTYTLSEVEVKRAAYLGDRWFVAYQTGLVSVDGENWRRISSISW